MTFAAGQLLSVSPKCGLFSSECLRSEKKRVAPVQAFTGKQNGIVPGPRPSSLYEVLRVKNDASIVEIKTAYRSLAKLYHPDSVHQPASDGRDFIAIHNAYATLSDSSARSVYDLSLASRGRRWSGLSVENQSRFYTTQRWETDQCW